ncbi:MAG: SAM-dependent methyltransferase [Micromonosporaceae bacterium]
MIQAKRQPGGFDPSVPSQARIYDYYLGGKDNYAADREAAELAMQAVPQLRQLARENRSFLGRTVRFCAEAGIRQFIDIGAGLPTQENTHQVAQRLASGSRVVYVDNDEIAVVHGCALLADNAQTGVIQGDLRQPGEILRAPGLRRLIDLGQPVAILLLAVLHFIPDGDGPGRIVAEFRDAMAPGSYLVLSHVELSPDHAVGTEPQSEQARMLGRAYRSAPMGSARGRAEIARFFDGFELVDPGLVEVWDWRSDEPPLVSASQVMTLLGGVGRKS